MNSYLSIFIIVFFGFLSISDGNSDVTTRPEIKVAYPLVKTCRTKGRFIPLTKKQVKEIRNRGEIEPRIDGKPGYIQRGSDKCDIPEEVLYAPCECLGVQGLTSIG